MISTLTFHYQDKLAVIISPAVELHFSDMKSSFNYNLETGGILIGTLNKGPTITITDITTSQSKDVRHKFRFLRSADGHQSLMDQLWEESAYRKMYLGEWHTHSEFVPSPSRWIFADGNLLRKKGKTRPGHYLLFWGDRLLGYGL